MSSLVIVALPAEDDIVWKISSEKVPHLTLMYLGEVSDDNNVIRMTEFVDHALNVNQHGPFYLDVDYRGELGKDKADVLFFKGGWDAKWIKLLRSQLLQHNDIRTAFEKADTFPEWLPHLTLGYPDAPAKELDESYAVRQPYSVHFDRIAVWTGDYEGAEFRLKWPDRDIEDEASPLYMSSANQARIGMGLPVVDELTHHGVKGMRWGVRTEKTAEGGEIRINKRNMAALSKNNQRALIGTAVLMPPLVPALFLSKRFRAEVSATRAHNQKSLEDQAWKKNLDSVKSGVKVHNKAAEEINEKLPGFNADKRWKDSDGKDIHLPSNPAKQKEYDRAVEDEIINPAYSRAAIALHGSSSPHGRYQFSIEDASTGTMKVRDLHVEAIENAKHAADEASGNVEMDFHILRDANGHVTGFEWPEDAFPKEDSMSQTEQRGAEFIEHFGVKGMRWGVRQDRHGRDRFDPAGHTVKADIVKSLVFPPGPNIPAMVRLGDRAVTGTKAYLEKRKQPEEVAKRAARKLARRDFYWEMHTYSDISHADVHNKVSDQIDAKVHQLQNAPKYRGKSLKADKNLANEYEQDVAKVTDSAYRRAVNDTYGVNPSGTKKAHYVDDARGARIEIRDTKSGKTLSEKLIHPVKEDIDDTLGHAATESYSGPDIMISVKTNDQGFVTEIGRVKLPEDEEGSVEHSDEMAAIFVARGSEFLLEHYGIKGMRWGVRNSTQRMTERSTPKPVAPTAKTVVPQGTYRKTKVKVKGGENHEASPDAIKIGEARAKLRKSGPAALSNKELQEVQTRLNLEKNVSQLVRDQTRIGKGRKFIKDITGLNKQVNETIGTGIQSQKLAKQIEFA